MKTIKLGSIAKCMLLVCSFIFINCSSDNNAAADKGATAQRPEGNSEIQQFLDTFYNKNYKYGESIETSDENGNYQVTEVIANSDESARGYIVTEKSTDKFLYFVDVDRTNYKLTTVDVDLKSTKVFTDIDRNPEYSITGEFNFMMIVAEANKTPSHQRRKFWGWSEWTPMGDCVNGHQSFVRTHYVLFMVNDHDYDVRTC